MIEQWREAMSMMLLDLINAASRGDQSGAEEVANIVELQLERVIELAPSDEGIH